jgi:hypothetical protein
MNSRNGLPIKPTSPEEERHTLTDRCRQMRSARVLQSRRQQRAQHAPAVHGKGRQHVERDEHHVDAHQALEKRAAGPADQFRRLPLGCRLQPDEQYRCDRDVDSRAGDRHPQLLARIIWHALEARHSADRQQRDVARQDTEPLRRQRMPELVQQDAGEEREDEGDTRECARKRIPFSPLRKSEPDDEQEERCVNVEADASNGSDPP